MPQRYQKGKARLLEKLKLAGETFIAGYAKR